MKVYGGTLFVKGVQMRGIIAGTQKQAADASHQSLHFIREYWAETGNRIETSVARSRPGVLFYGELNKWSIDRDYISIEPDQDAKVKRAYQIADTVHAGQKWGEFQYMTHVTRVTSLCAYGTDQIVALLNDTIEDGHGQYTLSDVQSDFGPAVCEAVKAITRGKDETYMAFIERCALNPVARRVKIADLRVNLSALPADHTLAERYARALKVLRG